MAWRAQISDRPIRRLAILPTKPGILAAWTAADRVTFLDLASGARVSDVTLALPPEPPPKKSKKKAAVPADPPPRPKNSLSAAQIALPDDVMAFDLQLPSVGETATKRVFAPPLSAPVRALLELMRAPNGDYLPSIRHGALTISSTQDGTARIVRDDNGWTFDGGGRVEPLDGGSEARYLLVQMDRVEGVAAALDTNARLHLYRGARRVGTFDTPLLLQPDLQPDLAIADGGTVIAASDGQRIILMDMTGKIVKLIALHYALGALALTPDAKTLIVGDLDAGVLRTYGGKEWKPAVQRFAVDLLADARRAQLIGTGAPSGAALGPIAAGDKGALAFALVGTICVTSVARMKPPVAKPPLREMPRDDAPAKELAAKETESKAVKG
jgi:hypothetical protein